MALEMKSECKRCGASQLLWDTIARATQFEAGNSAND